MFTHAGPSEEQMRATTFSFTNVARGYSGGAPATPGDEPDVEVVTRVSGPEPGYIACSIFVVQVSAHLGSECVWREGGRVRGRGRAGAG